MHHLYPSCKGDALCPLGFHPQVRWPTRCKRCFRDYKEHGGRRGGKDDIAASSPSLSSWNSQPQIPIQTTDIFSKDKNKRKTWSSSTNLYDENKDVSYEKEKIGNILSLKNNVAENTKYPTNRTASWTSTPDLTEESHSSIPTFNIILPRKRVPAAEPVVTDTGQKSESKHVERRPEANKVEKTVKKVKKLKEVTPTESTDKNEKIIKIKEVKPTAEESKNHDVQFLIQVKSKTFNHSDNNDMNRSSLKQSAQNIEDDVFSTAGTETTDTTLVDRHELHDDELQEQIDSLKQELDTVKARCEKAEREKSDMLLRRLATYETVTSKTTASEVLKLQQKCNELQTQLEDVKDDKKSLSLRVKELESDIENRPNPQDVQKVVEELKSKLMAAEQLCEELMDENEDMKKEMRYLEEEMEEMQDNFREDQANEYTSLKKELEQTTKNCRILSFKLRKTERKVEQLETEKQDAEKKLKDISGGQTMLENIEKMKRLEQDLNIANEVAVRLQKEVDEVNLKLKKTAELEKDSTKPVKKAPSLGTLHNISSGDKISRASLTRGGSQDDPVQLLRDLQDCLEREADLREQLKFAEEEAENLRKKASRVEDDNESLVLQLKKMATKARGHKLNPSSNLRSLATESSLEKDEGISEDEDPSELRLLLELSEQEASVLRRKIEDMERDADTMKRKLKDAQSKLNAKSTLEKRNISVLNSVQDTKTTAVQEQKMKVLEDETVDLRKKLIEKERDCERLYAELSITQKKAKGMQRSKSLDGDQQTLDLRRQLQVVEQEAVVLQSKLQNLETENEKLSGENKRLLLLTNKGTKKSTSLVSKIKEEKTSSDTTENNGEVSGIKVKASDEYKQLKQKLTKVENENEKLKQSISRMQTPAATLQTTRTPKTVTDLTPKSQLKNMVLELENEIGDILANLKTVEDAKANFEEELKQNKMLVQQNQESEKSSKEETEKQIKELEKKIAEQNVLITKEKNKFEDLNAKLTNEKNNIKKMEEEKKTLQKTIETTNTKLNEEQKKNLKTLSLKEKKIESLEKELEAVSKTVKEKSKVADQVLEKNKIIQEHEKRLLELTQKINNTESLLTTNKETISKLEKELESGKQTIKEKETEWLREKKELQNKLKQQSESKFEGSKTLDELEKNKLQLNEMQNSLDTSLADKKALESKVQKLEDEFKNEKTVWEKKAADLESDLLAEKKKLERMKTKYEKQEKTQQELIKLKQKIQTLQNESNNDANKIANKELTNELEKMKKLYEDLTSKYEILEEEHVVTKSKLIMEKGEVMNQLDIYKTELINMKKERDNLHQKQKELQEEIKNIYKNTKQTQQTTELEKSRLKSAETRLEEKVQELEQNRKEIEVLEDQFQNLRKENEDLKQKLDDFHKVSKVQRNINADNSALEKELVQMRDKLLQAERSHKTDLGENKLYYESQINTINEELQSLQNQVLKFKRERDMFKHMLEGTQRALSELKNMSAKSGTTISAHSDSEEVEETKLKIATLEQQTSCLEDELSEARLESTKLKTELVSERSSWEIKLQEMRSKINELEEDRLLSSGRTKIVGMRTRMELAWQKEREEQQRLLQETSTLARDLRQTLFEVERERDKERLEAKRKQEQLKKTAEEEQEENKKKLNELQCDLLELRDAHAKLRTTNEKLRREKEKTEREKDELKSTLHSRKKTNEDDENHVRLLLQQVEKLLKMVPESQTSSRATTPTPPKRVRGSKSRESSPSLSGTPTIGRRSIEREIQYNIQKLKDAMQDIQGSQTKARPNIRRSTSHDAREKILKENTSGLTYRSLSLEPDNRNVTFLNDEPSIWGKPESDSTSLTSLQSLDKMSTDSDRYYAMDSRLSSGSTQSEIITGTDKKKKKKSLMGTLKKLTKTRSMDENSGPSFYKSSAGSDSSMTSKEDSGSKVDLKDRITGIFKRGGSSSRSSSLERIKPDTSSLQRPVKFSTQHKPSPSPSETSISLRGSSSSRYKQY